jgi:hypothetical protein
LRGTLTQPLVVAVVALCHVSDCAVAIASHASVVSVVGVVVTQGRLDVLVENITCLRRESRELSLHRQ